MIRLPVPLQCKLLGQWIWRNIYKIRPRRSSKPGVYGHFPRCRVWVIFSGNTWKLPYGTSSSRAISSPSYSAGMGEAENEPDQPSWWPPSTLLHPAWQIPSLFCHNMTVNGRRKYSFTRYFPFLANSPYFLLSPHARAEYRRMRQSHLSSPWWIIVPSVILINQ